MWATSAGAPSVATARTSGRSPSPGDGDHCGTAEAVADEQLWRSVVLAEPRCGEPEVVEVGGEVSVGEIAFARAEAGEVEPEDTDAMAVELGCNAPRGDDILGTSEAVSEQREGPWWAGGKVEPAGERSAEAAGEGHSLGVSCHLVRSVRRAPSRLVNPLQRVMLPLAWEPIGSQAMPGA